MPPKSKRKIKLEAARATKKAKVGESSSASGEPTQSPTVHSDTSSSESDDPVFDPNTSLDSEQEKALAAQHVEEWVSVLSRDDLMSLSLTLHHVLVNIYGVTKRNAAEMIGNLIGKNERTVREWRKFFNDNGGSFPDSEQGHYRRQGVF